MDAKITLKRLHERFPEMTLDDLFAVLECFEETPSPLYQTIGTFRCSDYSTTCSGPEKFGGQAFQTVTK